VASEGDGSKRLKHPELGPLELEFSTFAVEARSDLSMIVYTAGNAATLQRIAAFIEARRTLPPPVGK
jgi:hypothetical protein